MNLDDPVISGSLTALALKLPLLMWLALSLVWLVDRRPASHTAWVFIGLSGLLFSLGGWAQATTLGVASAWLLSSMLAGVAVLLGLRRWIQTPTSASGSSWDNVSSSPGGRVGTWLIIIGGIATSGYAFATPLLGSLATRFEHREMAAIHLLASLLALANSLVCSLQLTFFSSPETLSTKALPRVRWEILAGLALAALLFELGLCGLLLMSLSHGDERSLTDLMLAQVFALTLLLVHFVAWLVPWRVVGFARSGVVLGWPSLAVSSWIVVLALSVVAALPFDWPWRGL